MKFTEPIYRGNARVYLQGKGALQLVDKSDSDCYTYFVGSIESSIKIKDFRKEPIEAAQAIVESRSYSDFASVFNQPAEIEITECERNIEIKMHSTTRNEFLPILWIGVIHDRKMPVHKIAWEALRSIREDLTAFAILVND